MMLVTVFLCLLLFFLTKIKPTYVLRARKNLVVETHTVSRLDRTLMFPLSVIRKTRRSKWGKELTLGCRGAAEEQVCARLAKNCVCMYVCMLSLMVLLLYIQLWENTKKLSLQIYLGVYVWNKKNKTWEI